MRLLPLVILSLLLLPLPAAAAGESPPVTTRNLLPGWLGQLRDYAPVLQAGVEALAMVDSAAAAPAALPAIRAVQEGDNAIRATARAMEAGRYYADDILSRSEVVQAMQSLPVGRYHAERARILRAGCFGDVALFLALTNREGQFTAEQAAAPVSDAERATLAQMQEVNSLLAAVRTEPDGERAGEKLKPLVRAISAALPGLNPAALCEAERLRQETDSHLARIVNRDLLGSRLLEALVLQPGCYTAGAFMTKRGEFELNTLIEHPFEPGADWPSCKQRCGEFRAAHAEAVAAFCKANGLEGGDGTTPETAIHLPRQLFPAERRALMMRFGREVLRERFVPFIGWTVHERLDGRACTCVAGDAGRTGDRNHNQDRNILVPFYFLLP